MKERDLNTTEIRTAETVPIDSEETLVAPHFDAAAIQHARPAVPLAAVRRRSAWPLWLVALAVFAGIAGGVLGSLAAMKYMNRSASEPVAQQTSAGSVAQPPNQSTEKTARSETAPAAQTVPQQTKASGAQVEQTSEAVQKPQQKSDERAAQTADAGREAAQGELVSDKGQGARAETAAGSDEAASLRSALNEWVAATNARDIDRQMSFYNPTVNDFYLSRNASREAVRAEKARVFERASNVDIRAQDPVIRMSPDGRTATMRFIKYYAIEGGGQDKRGEVLQELKWQRVNGKWRIVSERDLRVLQ